MQFTSVIFPIIECNIIKSRLDILEAEKCLSEEKTSCRSNIQKWGNGIVEQLSLDLQNEFPNVKGFSARNLWNMKKWYSFYMAYDDVGNAFHALEEQINTSNLKRQQVATAIREAESNEKLQQVVAEIPFPVIFGFVPWGHHIEIITKCHDLYEALFYIRKTIEEGWSRNALDNCIRANLYHTSGTAVTNFDKHLPVQDFCLNLVRAGHSSEGRRKSLSPGRQERLICCFIISTCGATLY